jgi:hypothetical protein
MNDNPTIESERIYRRLQESLSVFGHDVNPMWWWAVIVPVLLLGLFYVAWMYRRDSRAVHWYWALPLAMLRSSVYVLLAGMFLLPATQTWEKSEKRSRVLVLIDVSPSIVTVSDEVPREGQSSRQLATRLDKLVRFLTDDKIAFLQNFLKQNPVYVYRFGSRLDEVPKVFEKDQDVWASADWNAWAKLDLKPFVLQGLSDIARDQVRGMNSFKGDEPGTPDWATGFIMGVKKEGIPEGMPPDDKTKFEDNLAKLDKRIDVCRQIVLGTNVGDSVLGLINREAGNMVQGLVVISDGRSNLGSDSTIGEARARAVKEHIPIFTVALGEAREKVNIRITDVQTPDQTPPDDKFIVRVEIDGEGMSGQEKPVTLEMYKPGEDKPSYELTSNVTFQPGPIPHAQAEFQIDPEKLPENLKSEETSFKEIIEGQWRFRAKTPRDPRETFTEPFHITDLDAAKVTVIKKPLRVLLFASGPNKEYQFLRTLLAREVKDQRAELSVYLQNDGGRDGKIVQDVPPERLLVHFPNTLSDELPKGSKPEDKWYSLAQYDLVVAFDPDWSELTPEQLLMLQTWVEKQGGGLIYVAGPVYTFQLARGEDGGKLRPLADILPVIPGDSVLQPLKRNTKKPWRLMFPGVNQETDFLKLDDEAGKDEPLAGWESFFTGKPTYEEGKELQLKNGFYNYYPITALKPGVKPTITFADPEARGPDGQDTAMLAMMRFGAGKSAFIGSPEFWRLRMYSGKETFYERFWVKLARNISAGSRTAQKRRAIPSIGKEFAAGRDIRFEVRFLDSELKAINQNVKPTATVKAIDVAGKAVKDVPVKLTPKRSQGEWSGWFQGRLVLDTPGRYRMVVPIPDSGDAIERDFEVKRSDPELDETRPNYAALYALAGEYGEIENQIKEKPGVAEELRQRLRGSKATVATDKDTALPSGDKPKLFFDLSTADIIPQCVKAENKIARSRGPVDDLWDDGPEFTWKNKKQTIGTMLLVLVGLLSVEWLIRKLLRLA